MKYFKKKAKRVNKQSSDLLIKNGLAINEKEFSEEEKKGFKKEYENLCKARWVSQIIEGSNNKNEALHRILDEAENYAKEEDSLF